MHTMPHATSSVVQGTQCQKSNAKWRRSSLAVILIISLLLAACGGGASEPAPAPPPASGGGAATTNQSSAPPDNVVATVDFGLTEEEFLKAVDAIEAKIAECMSAAGFEYVAVDSKTIWDAMDADKELPGLSEEQFYNQYGLGISTLYTGEPPQLAEVDTPAKLGLGEQNVAIFESLAAADQVAYNQTLFGEHLDSPLAAALEREDVSRTGGCTRTAIEQVLPKDLLTVNYVNPKDYAIDNDPRMVEAFVKFGECIKEAGYEITTPEDIRPQITTRLDEITGGAPVAALSAEAKTALAELQAFERALASASFACEAELITPLREQIEEELAS